MQTLFKKIDGQIADECTRLQIPGLIVCVRNDDGILLHEPYGVHNIETGQKLSKDAFFPIASQSKSFTALAVLKLVEKKRLKLDDLLIDHLPHLNHRALAKVTVRDVLKHEARLGRGPETEAHYFAKAPHYPTAAGLRKPNLPDLVNPKIPAGQFSYSNFGYALLGLIIADKSGMAYEDYIVEHILKPNHWNDQIIPKRSSKHVEHKSDIPVGYWAGSDGGLHPAKHMYLEGFAAAAGYGGRIQAVSEYFHKLLTGQLLSQDGMKEMLNFKDHEPGSGYGLGLRRHYTQDGDPIIGHTGGLPGYDSATFYNPRLGFTVSLMRTQLNEPIEASEKYLLLELIGLIYDGISKHVALINDQRATQGSAPASPTTPLELQPPTGAGRNDSANRLNPG
jgi:D-alanyl-D-alanine carboxypeptidase